MLARDISANIPEREFRRRREVDRPVRDRSGAAKNGAKTDYWKTGHSYMKRRVNEIGAVAGFEKSGHFFFNKPMGRGYDDGLIFALAVCDMLDRNPTKTDGGPEERAAQDLGLADDVAALRRRDQVSRGRRRGEALRGVKAEGREGDRPADPRSRHRQRRARHRRGRHLGPAARLIEQARAGGGGRKPGLEANMRAMFKAVDAVLRTHPEVGEYNQTI
jgi:phosphomannomutase/phosphoglucomutase